MMTFLLCIKTLPKISTEARFKIIIGSELALYESLNTIKVFYEKLDKTALLDIIFRFENFNVFDNISHLLTTNDIYTLFCKITFTSSFLLSFSRSENEKNEKKREFGICLFTSLTNQKKTELLEAIFEYQNIGIFDLIFYELRAETVYEFLSQAALSNKKEFTEELVALIYKKGHGYKMIILLCRSKDYHLIPYIDKLKDFAFKEVAEYCIKNSKIVFFKKLVEFLNKNYRYNEGSIPSLFVYTDLVVYFIANFDKYKNAIVLFETIIKSIGITWRGFDYYFAYEKAVELRRFECIKILVPLLIENDFTNIRITNVFINMIEISNVEMVKFIVLNYKGSYDKSRIRNKRCRNEEIKNIIDSI